MKKDAVEILKARKMDPFVRGRICTILEAQKKKAFLKKALIRLPRNSGHLTSATSQKRAKLCLESIMLTITWNGRQDTTSRVSMVFRSFTWRWLKREQYPNRRWKFRSIAPNGLLKYIWNQDAKDEFKTPRVTKTLIYQPKNAMGKVNFEASH